MNLTCRPQWGSRLSYLLRSSINLVLCAIVLGGVSVRAEEVLDASLNEQVVMIPKKVLLFTIHLETTVFKPDGDGPFPLVIINHGKNPGNAHTQARARPLAQVRQFVERGYAVAIPMRSGFANSGGSLVDTHCAEESNGDMQAEDVAAALDYLTQLPYIDAHKIVVMGQSHGGLATIAFGPLNYPGVLGLVNFAGGLRYEDCTGWQNNLIRAFGSYGARTKIPSLWFYGDNDSYWPVPLPQQMYERYNADGGHARMVAFGIFLSGDAHSMFGSNAGFKIWIPEVAKFFTELGLKFPLEIPSKYERPSASGFAELSNLDALPVDRSLRDNARTNFQKFLAAHIPRAFAISPDGLFFAWSSQGPAPSDRALDICQNRAHAACRFYAIDNDVVWALQR